MGCLYIDFYTHKRCCCIRNKLYSIPRGKWQILAFHLVVISGIYADLVGLVVDAPANRLDSKHTVRREQPFVWSRVCAGVD